MDPSGPKNTLERQSIAKLLNYRYPLCLTTAMIITLRPDHEKFIQSKITEGQFSSPEEVVDMAFRLLEKCSAEYSEWISEVRGQVAIAKTEVERGEAIDGETFVEGILEKFRQSNVTPQQN
jgi:antitoxin ParD1/3/4